MVLFIFILLILLALVALTGVILSLITGIRLMPRFDLRHIFPTPPWDELFLLFWMLNDPDPLWHPGRGDLPDPMGETSAADFPNHPME